MDNLKQKLANIKCFLLDMDGTIYLDDHLFDFVLETLHKMKEKRRIIFLTNNSSKSSQNYIDKLKKIGIVIQKDEIYTSGEATIEYLLQNHPQKTVYLLGTKALQEEFVHHSIPLDDKDPDLLVLGYDKELTYEKLCVFTNFLHQNKFYIATHPDINCPSAPYFIPDIGAMMQMIEASTMKKPNIIIGKPYPIMGENIMKKYGLKANEIAMVGDRLYTDIAFANNCHFLSILVLSGETSLKDYNSSSIHADIVIPSIANLYDYL